MIYFDSSALVKRYLTEAGTDKVNSIVATGGTLATSKLTYPEILSAFARKHRAREIGKRALHGAMDRFLADWDQLFVIGFHDDLLKTVKSLIEKYALKAADTVHLSSALWLKHTVTDDVTFVSSDASQVEAALAENFKVLDPIS
jgi:predicted nucleic acid-binding protein